MDEEVVKTFVMEATYLTIRYKQQSDSSYVDIFDDQPIPLGTTVNEYYTKGFDPYLEDWESKESPKLPELPAEDALQKEYIERCLSYAEWKDGADYFYDCMQKKWIETKNITLDNLWMHFNQQVLNWPESNPLPPTEKATLERPPPPPPPPSPPPPTSKYENLKPRAVEAARLTRIYHTLPNGKYHDFVFNEIIESDSLEDYYSTKIREAIDRNQPFNIPPEEEKTKKYIIECVDYAKPSIVGNELIFYDAMKKKKVKISKKPPDQEDFLGRYFAEKVNVILKKGASLPFLKEEEEIFVAPSQPNLTLPNNHTASNLHPNVAAAASFAATANVVDPRDVASSSSSSDFQLNNPSANDGESYSALSFLKMRDFVRTMRRFLAFGRFSENKQEEHTYVATNVQLNKIDVHHLYLVKEKLSSERNVKLRLMRYMKADRIKFIKNVESGLKRKHIDE